MERERDTSSPELFSKEFMKQGWRLGRYLETHLDTPQASLVHPQDLTLIGAATLAGDEVTFRETSHIAHIKELLKLYDSQALARAGITRDEFRTRYQRLLGTNLAEGEVAYALREAQRRLDPEKYTTKIVDPLAHMLAEALSKGISLSKTPGIQLGFTTKQIIGGRVEKEKERSSLIALLSPVHRIVEYGPGVLGYHRIPGELPPEGQIIMIEPSRYASRVIEQYAQRRGLIPSNRGRLAVHNTSFPETATYLLNQGMGGNVDIVIASQVQFDEDELHLSFDYAQRLLKDHGLFLLQAPIEVSSGIPGGKMLQFAQEAFKEAELIRRYVKDENGKLAIEAVFRRPVRLSQIY